jgi:D-alanyl-lipoteichoic acid acyltransferase DltB (MBOAT superfamily)
MLFSSYEYFIFFPVYFLCFKYLKPELRLYLVVLGSLVFYGWWDPSLFWVPGVLCTIAYAGALWMDDTADGRAKRLKLAGVVIVLLLPLCLFKYIHFLFNRIVAPIGGLDERALQLSLPLGISFITFTMISYVADVHARRFKPEKSLLNVFAYTLFFPQLIAGPILRPAELLPQLLRVRTGTLSSIGLGLTIFSVGLIKKVVFADSIAVAIDPIFDNPQGHDVLVYWFAIVGFTAQIYCDFSGYTDMAIGSAVALGIKLPLNFDRPYAAVNLQDFWRRWHMTLSRWLRDYLYIPLGGNRASKPRRLANILVTMLLGGLWHGANWTFVFWGLLHGIGVLAVHGLSAFKPAGRFAARMPRQLKWALTVLFVMLTWVFFRAPDFTAAVTILAGAGGSGATFAPLSLAPHAFPIALIGLFAMAHRYDTIAYIRLAYRKSDKFALGVVIPISWLLAVAVSTGSSQKFIYFDF